MLRHFRGPKLHVGKHRPKKWRKMWGHRQALSRIRIDAIEDVQESMKIKSNDQDPLYSALMVNGGVAYLAAVHRAREKTTGILRFRVAAVPAECTLLSSNRT